jgi:spore germination cell wall hydrolase CwlJ-like protein
LADLLQGEAGFEFGRNGGVGSTTSFFLRGQNSTSVLVMLDGVRLPELRGAKFFHATYVNPGWKRQPKAKIGNHIFY